MSPPPDSFAKLGEHVAASLGAARAADGAAARVRARILAGQTAHRGQPTVRLHRARVFTFAAAAALCLVAIFVFRPRSELSFRVAGETANEPGAQRVGTFLQAPREAPLPLSFSDGTVMRLEPGARARVSQLTPRGATVLLESGTLDANVVHRRGAQWSVDAGPFEISVTGTRFVAGWDPASESIVVTLEEGSVVVKGCSLGDEGRKIVAGERLTSSCKAATALVERLGDDRPLAIASSPLPAPVAPIAPQETLEAEAQRAADASAAAPSTAPSIVPSASAAASSTASAADLLRQADAERYAGHTAAAKSLLTQVRRRFPSTEEAASAAFELGRLTFDERKDYAQAAEWFETYLRENVDGDLKRESLGRAMESRARAGELDRAEVLATRYLAHYPAGPHSNLARRIVVGGPPQ